MYVCSCNALTDVDLIRVISQDGVERPADVFAAAKCRAQCGTCVRTVCALLGLRGRCARSRDGRDEAMLGSGTLDGAAFALPGELEARNAA